MNKRKKLRWRAGLAEALGDVGASVQSLLGHRYLHLVELSHGLPKAIRQANVGGPSRNRYLDNLYGNYGLCVDLDGLQGHPDDQRWQDLRRINKITEQGFVALRYGWTDIDLRPCETAVQVAAVLRSRGWPGYAPVRAGVRAGQPTSRPTR